MKTVRAEFVCDWCEGTAVIDLDPQNRQKDQWPPGWGVLVFTVRPIEPDLEWTSHKYHVCSRNCATEILTKNYPRKAEYTSLGPRAT